MSATNRKQCYFINYFLSSFTFLVFTEIDVTDLIYSSEVDLHVSKRRRTVAKEMSVAILSQCYVTEVLCFFPAFSSVDIILGEFVSIS